MRGIHPKEKAKIAEEPKGPLTLGEARGVTILRLVLIACSGRQMLHRKGAPGRALLRGVEWSSVSGATSSSSFLMMYPTEIRWRGSLAKFYRL
jgi:hypothetical protein